jgi:hypothetical protein
MEYISLYSASIYQSAGAMIQITASSGGRSTNLITGSFIRTATGSYTFVSSGSFSGISGSITGSIVGSILYSPVSTSSLGSVSMLTSPINPNAFYVYVFSDILSQTLSDSAIEPGSYQIDVGISY